MTETLKLKDSAMFRAIDEREAALLDVDNRGFFSLNPTALCIIEVLRDGSTRDLIVETLCSRFQVTAESCGPDVDAFISTLNDAGLLNHS